MKTIKILGTGCPNCNQMEKIVQAVITQLNLNIKIEKVDDIQGIMKYNVMSTPALVIDEKVVIKGRVPSLSEVKALLTADACCADANSTCCSSDTKENSSSCCSGEPSEKNSTCCEPKSGCC